MVLDINNISSFITGAVRVYEQDGYIALNRFTEKQREHYINFDRLYQSASSAGIMLDFTTCGGKISFDYRMTRGAGIAEICSLSFVVDGICRKQFYMENQPVLEDTFTYEIEQGEQKRVTVYFSNLSCTMLKNIVLPFDSKKVNKSIKYLALGDSITQGYIAKMPHLAYATVLAQKLNAELLNQAIGGDIFCADALDGELNFKPDIITVALGTNDWGFCSPNLEADIKNYFNKLKSIFNNAKIFVITPIYRGGEESVLDNVGTLENVRELIRKLSPFPVIEGKKLIDWVEFDFLPDFLHPNDIGFYTYGNRLAEEICSKDNCFKVK